jgi:hypothetical protein
MACEHKGPLELMEMAEEHLRDTPREEWRGRRFRWTENVDGGTWASVIVEVERRDDQWIVTRIDRNPERAAEEGFAELASGL